MTGMRRGNLHLFTCHSHGINMEGRQAPDVQGASPLRRPVFLLILLHHSISHPAKSPSDSQPSSLHTSSKRSLGLTTRSSQLSFSEVCLVLEQEILMAYTDLLSLFPTIMPSLSHHVNATSAPVSFSAPMCSVQRQAPESRQLCELWQLLRPGTS